MKNLNTFFSIAFLLVFAVWYYPINISSYHSWGGDFAQYIQQAINIAEGYPINNSSYILNPEYTILGPVIYPNGFPLLLSAVYHFAGNSIEAFLHLNAIFYILYSICCFLILRMKFSLIFSILLTLLIMLNPEFLHNKGELISDVTFSVFFLGALYLMKYPSLKLSLTGIALFTAYAIFTRSMAWSIIAGGIIYLILNRKMAKLVLEKYGVYIILFVVAIVILIFSFPGSDGSTYSSLFQMDEILVTINQNLSLYSLLLRNYFPVYKPGFDFIQILTGAILLLGGLTGFILRLQRKDLISLILLVYCITAVIYPASLYNRFFYPIIPFIILFAGEAFMMLQTGKMPYLKMAIASILLLAIFFNFQHAQRVKNGDPLKFGPQHPSAREAFAFLKNNVKKGETVNFIKPRVLALYTNIPSISNHPQQKYLSNFYATYNVKWLMYSPDLYNPALEEYLNKHKVPATFKNDKIQIYYLGN